MINSKCIFVGNIPYDYDENSLKETLSLVGAVKHFNIKADDFTKKSKGFGFCEYTDAEIATSALRNLKNIDYNGRQLRINIQDNDKSNLNLSENLFKASKDISYIKENENENVNLSEVLKDISDEQKLLLLFTMKNILNKNPDAFNKLLENQSDDVINAIIDLQNSFLEKYSQKINKQ